MTKPSEEKIYIVCGQTGEYSDRREWVYKAYRSEDAAQKAVVACTKEGNRLKAKYRSGYDRQEPHSLDPGFSCDSTGFNYYIVECILENV